MSLIVGKTLTKKKDVIDFIGFIKATSGRSLDSFSGKKQKLFSEALKQVVGTTTASTQQGIKVIPKLSSKARNLIATTTGVSIVKIKPILKPIPVAKLRAITSKQEQISTTQTIIKKKQTTLTEQTQSIRERQGVLSKQKQTTAVKQKQKLLRKQQEAVKQKQK